MFALRSVAYPFNAKQPEDLGKRHLKVTKDGLEKMKAKIEVSQKKPSKILCEWIQFKPTSKLWI